MGERELFPEILFMDQLIIFLSIFILLSSLMTVITINPIHSVFWLVLVFINSAGLLISIGFDFIAFMLIIIYVGAIIILFLFVIMMIDIIQIKIFNPIENIIPIITIISVNLIIQCLWLIINNNIKFYNNINFKEWEFNILSQINILSLKLYSDYYLNFIIISVLLFLAMIGTIVLILEHNANIKRQILFQQHQRNNSWI